MIDVHDLRRILPMPRPLLVVLLAVLFVAGCGEGQRDASNAAAAQTETTARAPRDAIGDPAGAPPNTTAEGGFGLPPAPTFDSLGIEGVTAVTFPDRCEVRVTARNDAIGFAVGSAVVSSLGRENLKQIAVSLTRAELVQIEGHTSSEGDRAFNIALSFDRAAAVREILEPLVPGAAFSHEGFGPDRPVADNGNEDGRVQNRRVEIVAEVPEEVCTTFGA